VEFVLPGGKGEPGDLPNEVRILDDQKPHSRAIVRVSDRGRGSESMARRGGG
jgi:hypothetical protein